MNAFTYPCLRIHFKNCLLNSVMALEVACQKNVNSQNRELLVRFLYRDITKAVSPLGCSWHESGALP